MEKEYCLSIARKYLWMYRNSIFIKGIINDIFRDYEVLKQMEIDLRSELTEYDMEAFYKGFNKARNIVVFLAEQCKEIDSRKKGREVDYYDWIIEDL